MLRSNTEIRKKKRVEEQKIVKKVIRVNNFLEQSGFEKLVNGEQNESWWKSSPSRPKINKTFKFLIEFIHHKNIIEEKIIATTFEDRVLLTFQYLGYEYLEKSTIDAGGKLIVWPKILNAIHWMADYLSSSKNLIVSSKKKNKNIQKIFENVNDENDEEVKIIDKNSEKNEFIQPVTKPSKLKSSSSNMNNPSTGNPRRRASYLCHSSDPSPNEKTKRRSSYSGGYSLSTNKKKVLVKSGKPDDQYKTSHTLKDKYRYTGSIPNSMIDAGTRNDKVKSTSLSSLKDNASHLPDQTKEKEELDKLIKEKDNEEDLMTALEQNLSQLSQNWSTFVQMMKSPTSSSSNRTKQQETMTQFEMNFIVKLITTMSTIVGDYKETLSGEITHEGNEHKDKQDDSVDNQNYDMIQFRSPHQLETKDSLLKKQEKEELQEPKTNRTVNKCDDFILGIPHTFVSPCSSTSSSSSSSSTSTIVSMLSDDEDDVEIVMNQKRPKEEDEEEDEEKNNSEVMFSHQYVQQLRSWHDSNQPNETQLQHVYEGGGDYDGDGEKEDEAVQKEIPPTQRLATDVDVDALMRRADSLACLELLVTALKLNSVVIDG